MLQKVSPCPIVFVLIALLSASVAWSKPSAPPPANDVSQTPAPPHYTSIRAVSDRTTVAALSNGLTVIVQENHAAPVATVRCYVKNTGSAFEGRHLGAGLSHVLEHVVAGGTTRRRTEEQIRHVVDAFGGVTNAYTTTDMTSFFIDSPARDALTAVDLVADSMQWVTFEPREFARELKVVRRELADGEVDRATVLEELLNLTIYTVHPVRHPVIGYLDVLNATTNRAIIDFYHERYVPNNQVFVVVGDVKTGEVLDRVARQWADTPRRYETYVPLAAEPRQLSPREAVREMDGTTYDVALAWPTVKLSDPDMPALDLAAYILGNGDSSRLVRRLQRERQLALSVSASSETPSFVSGYFRVSASSMPDTWQEAGAAMLREVYRLRDEPVAPAELAKAKKQKAVELTLSRQTVQQAAESLGHGMVYAADPLFDEAYVKSLQQVTAEQIRDAARRWFVPERLNRVMVAPPGGAPRPARPATAAAAEEIRAVRLTNGVRVLVKRNAALPLVNIQAFVLGGSAVDAEPTAGRAALVADMLDKGAGQRSAEQIAEYFDSIGGQLSLSAGRFTINGSATTLREDFPQAAAVLADCFLRPTFPEREFEKERTLTLGAIADRPSDPHGEIGELFFDRLPATTPYHLLQEGKAETVKRLTAADLKEYHARWFVPENMVVAIFGDIEPAVAIKLAGETFAQLKPSAAPKIDFRRDNALPKSVTFHKQTGKDTGMVMLGYPCESIFDKEDHAAMQVLKAIMSGYSYPGGWLFTELREEGLVYAVGAGQVTGPAPGYFVIQAQARPDKLTEVVERIRRNVERARQGKITADEFRIAVDQIVALHAQENTTLGEQARVAALDELYGLGYDYDRTLDARIKAVKLEDVVRAARKYLDKSLLVTTSPEKQGP